ncbi:uncharacterized protein LOC121373231 [Gigantopelta aegis]|uniref:uncharacterized protein LOC121373231 n=1 Tax=Gigantopelta aegis TaxID=1735272 RepID=UPI001B88C351|nr:uncharacterized protein LOC121373231 [Gigantopelta aegis]
MEPSDTFSFNNCCLNMYDYVYQMVYSYYERIDQWFQFCDSKEPSSSSSFLFRRDVSITKVLGCLVSEGDGAYPPAVATAMFAAACFLLVLPTLFQICTRRFFRNLVRLLNIVVIFSLLGTVMIVTTAIQANDVFCFLSTKRMRELIDPQWEPAIAVFLMAVLALVNLFCARMFRDGLVSFRKYVKQVHRRRSEREQLLSMERSNQGQRRRRRGCRTDSDEQTYKIQIERLF